MKFPIYQVDAFSKIPFGGNAAAVILMDDFLSDDVLLNIAIENNLSETAFVVKAIGSEGFDYHLRWFTPAVEVDLCGHATLASAHVILKILEPGLFQVAFSTRSGILTVSRDGDKLKMDFPVQGPEKCDPHPDLFDIMGETPLEVYRNHRDHLLIYNNEDKVRNLRPNFSSLKTLGQEGFIATAPGDNHDFVSRCFFPGYDLDEDPVTGSAHVLLGPYWAQRLGKNDLTACQISERRGDLWLKIEGDRIFISGYGCLVMTGEMVI
ncbi:MAG: PhzF family phenazine biosynthesis protein [Sphingomonadales bacterium]|jgi:PhzF family phenazine biosynthesis protein